MIVMISEKGTIGLTMNQSDMPFTEEGISPDLIINPHCIPKRMTVGQLVECLVGKVAALKGVEADGTPFNEIDIEKVKDELEKLGYERNATEYVYCGLTGQRLKIPIFIGPTYYQRLKHLVMDKHLSITGGCGIARFLSQYWTDSIQCNLLVGKIIGLNKISGDIVVRQRHLTPKNNNNIKNK